MVEFAIVVVLLITLVYGIVSVGLTLAAKVTLAQAAADGARAGIVATSSSPSTLAAAQIAAANAQASNDVSWMGQGACGTSNTVITCSASEASCSANATQTCLTETVTYNYSSSPLFPALPGLGIIEPTSISSTSTLQVSTPTS
jgi:Flp pilus assembly protein TadG